MPRIQAFALILWLALAGGLPGAGADVLCGPEEAGTRRCRAGLPGALIQRMQVAQQKSQWCWAASLEMVFARYGHSVPQAEIVERLYGVAHDLPIRTRDIADLVARDWFDAAGAGFSAKAVPHLASRPSLAGLRQLLQALADEHPLLLATGRHVVVLVALEFEQAVADGGLRITGGLVLDPAPAQGLRALTREESRPALLAHVRIRPRPPHFTSVAELNEAHWTEPAAPREHFAASFAWSAALASSETGTRDAALNGRAQSARD